MSTKKELEKHIAIMNEMEGRLKEQLKTLSEDSPLNGSPADGGLTIGQALAMVKKTQEQLIDTLKLLAESREAKEAAKKELEETRRRLRDIQREPEQLAFFPFPCGEPS